MPLVATRIAQDTKVLDILVENHDVKENEALPMPIAAIQNRTTLDPSVLESLLDYMSTQFMVEATGSGQYKATKMTHMLLTPLFQDGVFHKLVLQTRS